MKTNNKKFSNEFNDLYYEVIVYAKPLIYKENFKNEKNQLFQRLSSRT